MSESEVMNFIDYYSNDKYEGTFESHPSKKKKGGIGRAEKGDYFNEALENCLEDIN